MKKIFSILLVSLILITNIITPISVFAAAPTIAIQFVQDSGHSSDNLRSWYFVLNTTGIPDGNVVSLNFFINNVDVTPGTGYISTKITGNTGSYNTGFILKPATTYKITAKAPPGVITSFEQLTLGTVVTPPPSTDTTTPWWFNGSDGGIRDLPAGFLNEASCIAKRKAYIGTAGNNSTLISDCFQLSAADAQLREKTRLAAPIGGYVGVDAVNSSTNSSKYTLLAPLPGLKPCLDWNSDPAKKDPGCMGANIGEYLNIIFKLLIGICAALAVIMLIVYGIMYMGEESIFGKVEAKSKMISAIFGLIIALGAWALLNTLNPALTGAGGFAISSANVQLDPLVHGDNPQTPQAGGMVCGTPGKYKVGDLWPDDSTIRSSITSSGITINRNNCKTVGEQNCTSVTGLNTSGVIALKNKCNGCSLMITGATECWLHSTNTSHLPGNSTVDLSFLSAGLTSYIETGVTPVQSNMGFPVFTKDGTKFMKEKDHYHIISW